MARAIKSKSLTVYDSMPYSKYDNKGFISDFAFRMRNLRSGISKLDVYPKTIKKAGLKKHV